MPTAPLNKRGILVMDDEAGVTTLCRRVLEQSGEFRVEVENDAVGAVETVRTFVPHLILLDHHLPGRTGPEIAGEIAADSALQGIPIVFLTGDVDAAAARMSHPTLLKPVRAGELVETCRAWTLASNG